MLTAKDLKPYNVYELYYKEFEKNLTILCLPDTCIETDKISYMRVFGNSAYSHTSFQNFDFDYEILRNLTEESYPPKPQDFYYKAPKVLLDGDFVADVDVLKDLYKNFFYHIRTFKRYEFGDGFSEEDAFCDRFPGATKIQTLNEVVDQFLSYSHLDKALDIKKRKDNAKKEPEKVEVETPQETNQETKPEISDYVRKHIQLMTALFGTPEFVAEFKKIFWDRK